MIGYNAYRKILDEFNSNNKRGMVKVSIITDGIEGIPYMLTTGRYFIKYTPTNKYREQRRKKVIVCLDLGRKIRVDDWEELVRISKVDALYQFVLEYTNISKELMQMAIDNPQIRIPFCLDMIKLKKATEEQLRKEHKPIEEYGLFSTIEYPPRKKK